MTLRDVIVDEIRRRSGVPFSRFMELALYHAQLGYYSREQEKFGRGGDFYTASDIHAIFGRLLARQFDEMWRALGPPGELDIIELGPGRGLFAQDVLAWSGKHFPDFAQALRYRMVESSPSLHARLLERFQSEIEQQRVKIHRALGEVPHAKTAIVFANEFFDALPVEAVTAQGQLWITLDEGSNFREEWHRLEDDTRDFIKHFGVRAGQGERVEAAPRLPALVRQIGEKFECGFVVIVDYGYVRAELEAGLHRDTVRAFREHTLRTDILDSPGEQDITADVNFTAIMEVARQHGLDAMPLLRQSQFLIGIGEQTQFSDVFEGCSLPQEHAKRALQLKHLITPEGLGEAFKVLVLFRGVDREKVAALSGMTFARQR